MRWQMSATEPRGKLRLTEQGSIPAPWGHPPPYSPKGAVGGEQGASHLCTRRSTEPEIKGRVARTYANVTCSGAVSRLFRNACPTPGLQGLFFLFFLVFA